MQKSPRRAGFVKKEPHVSAPRREGGGGDGARGWKQKRPREKALVFTLVSPRAGAALGAVRVRWLASSGCRGVGTPAAIGQVWSHAGCRAAFYVPVGWGQGGRVVRLRWCSWRLLCGRAAWWWLPGISCLGSPEGPHRCHPCTALRRTGTGRTARAMCPGGWRLPRAASLFQRHSRTNAQGGAGNIGGGAVMVKVLTSCRAALDGWAPTLAHR